MSAPFSTDAANLAGLLRRERALCTACAAAKLALPLGRIYQALDELERMVELDQDLRRCPLCGYQRWVVAMARGKSGTEP